MDETPTSHQRWIARHGTAVWIFVVAVAALGLFTAIWTSRDGFEWGPWLVTAGLLINVVTVGAMVRDARRAVRDDGE